MSVVEEVPADELFKIPFLQGILFQLLQRLLEGDQFERVGIVYPGIERFEPERESAGETAGIILAQFKLKGVEGRFDVIARNTLGCEFFQGLVNECLSGWKVFRFNAFEADGIHRLDHVCFDAAAGEIFAEAGFNEGLAQR